MAGSVLDELFGTAKPIIAMAHFPPLPGTPLYDPRLGVQGIIDHMKSDADKLLRNGVDSLLFFHLYRNGVRRGYKAGEFSWILEDNEAMNRILRRLTPEPYRTYRVYGKSL